MATLKITGFSGEIPRLIPRLLPDMAAQVAKNTRLTDGGLTPVREPRSITVLESPPPDDDGTIFLKDNEWLSWPGLVHPVPGPVAQDRIYYTGDGAPKMRVNGNIYPLALPGPTSKPTTAVSGTGSGDEVTRLYVYTLVTEFGEESMPSPISDEVLIQPGQTVTLSGIQSGIAGRGITLQRFYRSQTGQGGTSLFFIAERAVSTTDFVDNIPVTEFSEPIPSTNWSTPPDGMEFLVSMPNGMMAAFEGRTVYFCEPYRPHAWPEIYTLTTDYPIVALGSFGTSLAILTKGNPYVASGTNPESMIMEKLELNLPCINAWAVVDLGYAVAYPSHDGLVVVSSGGARVITESLFSRDDWQGFSPESFSAGQYDGRYYASYIYTDERNQERRGTLIIDLSGSQPFIIRADIETRSFYYDIETGALYYLRNGEIFQWDAPGSINDIQTWRSKEYILPRPTNFGAILLEVSDFLSDEESLELEERAAEVQAQRDAIYDGNGSLGEDINGHMLNETAINADTMPIAIELARNVSVNIYADNALRATISRYNRMARLPAGFKARKWVVEVSGQMPVEQITLATTGAELMGV